MQKTVAFTLVSSFLFLAACKQKNTTPASNSSDNEAMKMYQKAMEMGDFQTAIYSLNLFLQTDSTDVKWYDTLAVLYINSNNFLPASWCADKVLKNKPKELRMLELKAMAEQQLGRRDKILDVYKSLFEITGNYQYVYQTAAVEFTAGNIDRCKNLIDSMMTSKTINKDSIDIQVSEDESQKVPLKAAIYNLQAFIKARDGKYLEAKKDFENALRIFPDFILAKKNLQDLMKGGRQQ
jgi:tetratricopeptide (TPR) repeat protein